MWYWFTKKAEGMTNTEQGMTNKEVAVRIQIILLFNKE
jgi:hypothetical protein